MATWTINHAYLAEETPSHILIAPTSVWLGRVVLLSILMLDAVFVLFLGFLARETNSWGLAVVAVFFLVLGVLLVLLASDGTALRLDRTEKKVTLIRKLFWNVGLRRKSHEIDAAMGVRGQYNYAGLVGHTVIVNAHKDRVILQFGKRGQDAERVMQVLQDLNGSSDSAAEAANPPVNLDSLTREAMLREVRSWGFWQIGLGAVHLIASGFLSAPWGIVLIGVGLASFYFREAAMFVIYATTLTWAGISNLFSGETRWIVGAFLQFYFAFRIMQSFRRFRQSELKLAIPTVIDADDQVASRAGRIFPWAALAFGLLSILWPLGFFGLVILVAVVGPQQFMGVVLGQLEPVAINLAVLGIGLGLASLLSGFRKRAASVIGLILGLATVLIEFALIILL